MLTIVNDPLSEMRPVNVETSIMCHLKRPLRYGGYLCNQIQQNNIEMLSLKGNALQCVDCESYLARSDLEISDTIYLKHLLRCDHSVTISQRSVQFRNGVGLNIQLCNAFANYTFWDKK